MSYTHIPGLMLVGGTSSLSRKLMGDTSGHGRTVGHAEQQLSHAGAAGGRGGEGGRKGGEERGREGEEMGREGNSEAGKEKERGYVLNSYH